MQKSIVITSYSIHYTKLYEYKVNDEDLFDTKNFWGKIKITPNDKVNIRLDAALNKNDQALYPGKMMDSVKDEAKRFAGGVDLYEIGT